MKLADGRTLIHKTYSRAARLVQAQEKHSDILTITNREYYFLSKDELDKAQAEVESQQQGTFLLEPQARNTTPAIAMAARLVAHRYGLDACMLVLPADHLIEDHQAFAEAVDQATELAKQDYLVTFGIVPDKPETGFGYIQAGNPLGIHGNVVKRFVEKPGPEKAREYLKSGDYYWNSGMFCFRAGAMLAQLKEHAPDVATVTHKCWEAIPDKDKAGGHMLEIPANPFAYAPDISIDYAVMERSSRVAVTPSTFGWSDIGSWNAVKGLVAPDKANNRALGDVIFVDSHNTFVQSEDRLVATVGVDNLMVIDTPDALLVTHTDKAQDVRKVVERLKTEDHEAYKIHRTVARPWGAYTVLEEGPHFKIKRIEVKPGASLSLQMHHHRSEHWVVVSGTARVRNDEREFTLNINESTFIPAEHKHRLKNLGTEPLIIIEVQTGGYLGEDDIVRFHDSYGRAALPA